MTKGKTDSENIYVRNDNEAKSALDIVMNFLALFIPRSMVKRVLSIVLLAAGLSVPRIEFLTGLTDRSIKSFGRTIRNGETAGLLELKKRSGRPSKAADVEGQILEELEQENYHTRQQIVDMIKEKFGISMSVMAVGRLLKKTASKG